jgi:predicted component of type VI protein secretion system
MITMTMTLPGAAPVKLDLDKDEITLGRSAGNTVVINHKKVSRKHAKIERVGESYQISDLDSGNGTRVNGEKISFHVLKKGDEIRIGDAVLSVKAVDEGPDRIEIGDDAADEIDLLQDPKSETEPALRIELEDDEKDKETMIEKEPPKPAKAPPPKAAPKPAPKPIPLPLSESDTEEMPSVDSDLKIEPVEDEQLALLETPKPMPAPAPAPKRPPLGQAPPLRKVTPISQAATRPTPKIQVNPGKKPGPPPPKR